MNPKIKTTKKKLLFVLFFFVLFSFGKTVSANTFTMTWDGVSKFASTSPTTGNFCVSDYPYYPSWGVYGTSVVNPSTCYGDFNVWSIDVTALESQALNSTGGHPNTDLHFMIQDGTGASPTQFSRFSIVNHQIVIDSDNTNTRVTAVSPGNNTTTNSGYSHNATSTAPITVSVDIFFNDVLDSGYIDQVCVYLENEEGVGQSLIPICQPIIASAGSTLTFNFTNLSHGKYFAIAYFSNGSFEHFFTYTWEFTNIYSSVPNQTCLFSTDINGGCSDVAVSTSTPYQVKGIPLQDCSQNADLPTKALCSISNALIRIINFLFIPDSFVFTQFMQDIHDDMLTHFPLGYITDFVSIMSTTTKGTLTPISGTIPPNVPGTGAHFSLTIDHVLDPLLNATTSKYFNGDIGSSTQTFYDYTSYYWNFVVYLFAILYIVRRILGRNLIPK